MKTTYTFTKKLHSFLREHGDRIEFKKLRGVYAYYYLDGHIEIDYRKDIISSLIHEFLHHIYPKWCETRINRKERIIVNNLSARQVKNIIKNLARGI